MRATPPPTPPPISAPRWLDDDGVAGAGKTVWMITFVVVMRPPLAADVTTDTTELVLRLVGEVCTAPFPASLVIEVEVDVDVDVVADVKVEVGIIRLDELDELDVDVVVISLDVVSPLPELPELPWFPIMAAEATAGPSVLIEATEVPLGNGKKSLGLVLSQQTLDALRLWSQHQLPP